MELNKYELLNRSYSFVSFDNSSLTIAVKNLEDKTVNVITLDNVKNVIGDVNITNKMITKCETDDNGNKILDLIIDNQSLKMEYTNYSICSIKVFEKIGFVKEGVRRESAFFKESNLYKDFIDYGLLNSEYRN